MNLDPLRRLQSRLSVAFIAAAALVLSSCGGGGATGSPSNVGALQLLPGTASIYAGVPTTLNIVGGRSPYLVTSSEPTLVPLKFTTSDNSFTFVARNPGVVDVGLDPDEVPRRTVNIEVRDSNGASVSNAYNVLQNFFTGYSESYVSTCATSSTSTGPAPQACSGADSLITLQKLKQVQAEQEKGVVALRDAAQLSRPRYDNGLSNYLEILIADQQLFQQELQLASSRGRRAAGLRAALSCAGRGMAADARGAGRSPRARPRRPAAPCPRRGRCLR